MTAASGVKTRVLLDLQDASLSGLTSLAAEGSLKGAVLFVEDGVTETLRWSGALDILFRSYSVHRVVRLEDWGQATHIKSQCSSIVGDTHSVKNSETNDNSAWRTLWSSDEDLVLAGLEDESDNNKTEDLADHERRCVFLLSSPAPKVTSSVALACFNANATSALVLSCLPESVQESLFKERESDLDATPSSRPRTSSKQSATFQEVELEIAKQFQTLCFTHRQNITAIRSQTQTSGTQRASEAPCRAIQSPAPTPARSQRHVPRRDEGDTTSLSEPAEEAEGAEGWDDWGEDAEALGTAHSDIEEATEEQAAWAGAVPSPTALSPSAAFRRVLEGLQGEPPSDGGASRPESSSSLRWSSSSSLPSPSSLISPSSVSSVSSRGATAGSNAHSQIHTARTTHTYTHAQAPAALRVEVRYLCLHLCPLFASPSAAFPSLLLLRPPLLHDSFPLTLARLFPKPDEAPAAGPRLDETDRAGPRNTSSFPTKIKASRPGGPRPPHVSEASAADISELERKNLRALAASVACLTLQLGLKVEEHAFALGPTSKLVGNTTAELLGSLRAELGLGEDTGADLTAASLVLVDRTLDLATCTRRSASLLDRVIQSIPALSSKDQADPIEVYPVGLKPASQGIHDPSILSPSRSSPRSAVELSHFTAGLRWRAGTALVHPQSAAATDVLRSAALKPGKGALLHLQRELRTHLKEELELGKRRAAFRERHTQMRAELIRSEETREKHTKRGKKAPRGRDVVFGLLQTLAESNDGSSSLRHSELLQVGLAMIEALARTDEEPPVSSPWSRMGAVEQRMVQCLADARRKNVGKNWGQRPMVGGVLRCLVQELADRSATLSAADAMELGLFAFSLVGEEGVEGGFEDIEVMSFVQALTQKVLQSRAEDISALIWLSERLKQRLLRSTREREARTKAETNTSARIKFGSGQSKVAQEGESEKPSDLNLDDSEGAEEDEWQDWGDTHEEAQADARSSDDYTQTDHAEREELQSQIEAELTTVVEALKEVASMRRGLKSLSVIAQEPGEAGSGPYTHAASEHPSARGKTPAQDAGCKSLLASLCQQLVKRESPVEDLVQVGSAFQQLSRAGLGLLSSGFSRFGFGSGGSRPPHPADTGVIILFVIGGFTFAEAQEVAEVLARSTSPPLVLLASNCITTPGRIVSEVIGHQNINC